MTVFNGLSAMALLNLCLDFCLEERESIWNEYKKIQSITLLHIFPCNRYFPLSELVYYILRRNAGEILARSFMHHQFLFKIAVIMIIET